MIRYLLASSKAWTGTDRILRIPPVLIRRITVRISAKTENSVTELPIKPEHSLSDPAPTDRLMHTVVPMARPTITTVSMCMTWLPTATAETAAAPLNCPVINRSAIP